MKKKEATIFTGNMIEINGFMARHEIVREVVNVFIDSENETRGRGVKFHYPVENLSIGEQLFIFRPGGLNKWNFDFKVKVPDKLGLGKGTHDEIVSDFANKKQENPRRFSALLQALAAVYEGSENLGGASD